MAFCNIAAGSRFLCFSFLFTRRCISLVQWRGTPDLRSGPPGWASPSSRHEEAGGEGGRGPARPPPASSRPASALPPGPRDQRSPVPARARSAPRGCKRECLAPAKGFPSRLRPRSAVSSEEPASRLPPRSRQEAVVLSSDPDGSEAALRVIPGVKYSGLASSFLSSNPVAREQETPPRKPQDSPHLAN